MVLFAFLNAKFSLSIFGVYKINSDEMSVAK